MIMEKSKLLLSSSPHLHAGRDVPRIMHLVLLLLLPVCIAGVYFFGTAALLRIVVALVSALAAEYLCLRARGLDARTLLDGSAALTGILLALTLPPTLPLFITVLGSVVAVTIGKHVFGGLGYNIFNPALVGRAFLQASFPLEMTTWVDPFFYRTDGLSGATPLGGFKFSGDITPLGNLFSGNTGGCIGETSALLILLAGILLLILRLADWRIPTAVLGTVLLFASVIHLLAPDKYGHPLFYLLSGGLLLGAFFMATDMVTSPVTPLGSWIFGIGIGLVVMVIRVFGGLPEGMMFAILFMNAFVPLLNRYTRPRYFGEVLK